MSTMPERSLPEDLREFSGVTADSRAVTPGALFVATRGKSQDAHRFIPQAVANGAAWIVGEEPAPAGLRVPYTRVPDARRALSKLASGYFSNPSRSLKVIGVTGTSGKTTTTYLLEAIFRQSGYKTGLLGTVEFRFDGKTLPSSHTTPGAVELQRLLAEMRDAGCQAVIMEVSSHALKQHRVADVAFDAMVFTNLTREHLDFHPDIEDYYQSKKMLFTELVNFSRSSGKRPVGAIFSDNDYGQRLLTELSPELSPELSKDRFSALTSFGKAGQVNDRELRLDLDGIHGKAAGVTIDSALTGTFNVSNILGAVAVATGLGLDACAIARGISDLSSVPGRLESIPNSAGIHVLVDYAHKPDALEKVLLSLRAVKGSGRLITVFGCGGDRDRTKRPVMGKLSAELSEAVIVTSDNPRTEDPGAIIAEIVAGMKDHSNYSIEADRKRAIETAIFSAKSGDIVLIAGKGHEDYQIIGSTKHPFDDRKIAAAALAQRL